MSSYAIGVSFVLIVTAFAYVALTRILQQRACYNLYRVRDRFVLLVADGKLPEDSHVFTHYYNRINGLLESRPNIGLDSLVKKIIYEVSPEKFDEGMEKARKKLSKLSEDPLLQDDDVRAAVADYYQAVRAVVLSHSSLVKLLYILSHVVASVVVDSIVSGATARALKVARYVENAMSTFSPTHGTRDRENHRHA